MKALILTFFEIFTKDIDSNVDSTKAWQNQTGVREAGAWFLPDEGCCGINLGLHPGSSFGVHYQGFLVSVNAAYCREQ